MGWWYVRRATGENVGPLNESGVVAELDTGRLMPNGWVCPSGGTEWVLVSAQREFVQAVEHALLVLGEAPTAYTENQQQQRQLAALYEASIEGPSPVAQLPPSKRPTEPPPLAITMDQPLGVVHPAMAQHPGVQPVAQHPGVQPMAQQPGMAQRPAPTLAMTQQPQPVAQPGTLQQAPFQPPVPMAQPIVQPGYRLSVSGPSSAQAPVVPANPLTESFGALGWLAVLLTGLTSFAYLIDAAVLIAFALSWFVVVAFAAAANFAVATIQLIRRRNSGFLLAFGGHGVVLGLVILSTIINVAMSAELDLFMVLPVGLVFVHVVAMVFLHLARSLFWIRA